MANSMAEGNEDTVEKNDRRISGQAMIGVS